MGLIEFVEIVGAPQSVGADLDQAPGQDMAEGAAQKRFSVESPVLGLVRAIIPMHVATAAYKSDTSLSRFSILLRSDQANRPQNARWHTFCGSRLREKYGG